MTSRWLFRLANSSPFVQAAAILAALALLGGIFLADYAIFGSGGAHHSRQVAVQASPTSSPEAPIPLPATATGTVTIPVTSTVATAKTNIMLAYSAASTRSSVVAHLTQHNLLGDVNAFLVVATGPGGWVKALLPVRPNGTAGWFPPEEVDVGQVSDYLLASLSSFKIDHYRDGKLVSSYPIGVGLPNTPTPTGLFYVYGIQTNPGPPYDPVIVALSAFSPTLLNWPLGGIVGIHGWSDTSVEGKNVSNGCMRMRPGDASKLSAGLPLGTPVQVIA